MMKIDLQYCIYFKTPDYRWTAQFKPVLFDSQLYIPPHVKHFQVILLLFDSHFPGY